MMDNEQPTYQSLPLYKIALGDNLEAGIDVIAITSTPAIEEMGVYFSANKAIEKVRHFQFNEEKQVIVGPAMIPDLPIHRKDADGYEYFVVFTKDIIEQLVERFNKNTKREFQFNLEHEAGTELSDIYIKSNWIIEDVKNDKSNMYGFSLPEGTWMIEAKVDNKSFWMNQVKGENKTGFSIEGLLGLSLSNVVRAELNKENKTQIKMELTKEEIALIEKMRADALALAEAPAEEEVIEEVVEEAPAEEEVIEEAPVEEVIEEAPVEEVVEEELAEEAPAEEALPALTEEAVSEMIQVKYDELLAMISELKNSLDNASAPAEDATVAMSKVEKFNISAKAIINSGLFRD